MSQAHWRQMASSMAVVKGQLNSAKRRLADLMVEHGENRLGSEKDKGTDMDLVGTQCYSICWSIELTFRQVDRLTDLIRQNGEMPVLEKNPDNDCFLRDAREQTEKIRKQMEGMSKDEKVAYLQSTKVFQ